jgi:stress-induced morphogen
MFSVILEQFTGIDFSPEVIEEAGICHNCFIKFNEYDEHKTTSEKIQEDLVNLFESSNLESTERNATKQELTEDTVIYETLEESYIKQEDFIYESLEGETINPPISTKPKSRKSADDDDELSRLMVNLEDNTRVFQCDVCSRTFKEKSKLKCHRLIHTTERNVICNVRTDKFPPTKSNFAPL